MKIKSLLIAIMIIPTLFMLAGCGVRKKNLLNSLSAGMSKKEVATKIGKPDSISSPIIDKKGNIIDIWEYSLATVNQNQKTKQLAATIVLALICPITAFIPVVCMDSPYCYSDYFLKFVNNLLFSWGEKSEMRLIEVSKMFTIKENL
jgi:hypothetical protein